MKKPASKQTRLFQAKMFFTSVFTLQEPRWKGSTGRYEDRKSTWNSGVWKAIRRESAEEEVRKHRDRVTGA